RSARSPRKATPGRPAPATPALVLVGARPGDQTPGADLLRASDPSFSHPEAVAGPGRPDDLRAAVERARSRRSGAGRVRALLALDGPERRAAARLALTSGGASVVDVADGLELLEVLGSNLALAPVAWVPEVLIMDARLER